VPEGPLTTIHEKACPFASPSSLTISPLVTSARTRSSATGNARISNTGLGLIYASNQAYMSSAAWKAARLSLCTEQPRGYAVSIVRVPPCTAKIGCSVSFSGSGNYPVTAAKRGLRRAVTGSPPIPKDYTSVLFCAHGFRRTRRRRRWMGSSLISIFLCVLLMPMRQTRTTATTAVWTLEKAGPCVLAPWI
jgi:hypothetical protein